MSCLKAGTGAVRSAARIGIQGAALVLATLVAGCAGTDSPSGSQASSSIAAPAATFAESRVAVPTGLANDELPIQRGVTGIVQRSLPTSHPANDQSASHRLVSRASVITTGSASVVAATGPSGHSETTGSPGVISRVEATTTSEPSATVEDLLEEGLHRAGVSPVHLAIRGTPAAGSVRCAWRGIARTAQQRENAIRYWLQLAPSDAIPDAAIVELMMTVALDTLDPEYRETAKANFLAIARGGLSTEYLFLTCFADYAVTNFLLGTGTTPTTVTVAYDRTGRGGVVRPVRAGARHGDVWDGGAADAG